jgi:hypothetical protein
LSFRLSITCVSSDEEDDLYPPYPQQVEDTNMIVVSEAPEFLPLPPKMKMPKQAKFNVLPPNKMSKKKPDFNADIALQHKSQVPNHV